MRPSALKTTGVDRALLYVLLIPLLVITFGCGLQTFKLVRQQTAIKEDSAKINSIRNGLLSVELWKTHIQNIVGDRITHLEFSPEQEAALKIEIGNVLKALLTEADAVMRKPQKTLRGKVRKVAFKTFINIPALKKETPAFSQSVLNEIKKPASLEKLKVLALSQLNNYALQTRDNVVDPKALQAILDSYHAKNTEEFNARAEKRMRVLEHQIRLRIAIMTGSLFIYMLAWWLVRKKTGLHKPLFALSVILAFIVLISSLALPLIDIDARINNVDFLLLGEHLHFDNQILYYRSKSIMQMVKVLVVSGKPDSTLVGLLLLVFSILFPIAKLIASSLSLYGSAVMQNNRGVRFFAYYSGKWSMADVFVVAIFMSYIGFNGILNDQLKNLNLKSESWQLIATNGTSLQPGFILFVSFVIFGLLLSEILKKIAPEFSTPHT